MWTQEIKKLDENMFASDLEGWNREARGDLNEQQRSGGFNCWCCCGSRKGSVAGCSLRKKADG